MIIHPMEDTSVVASATALAVVHALITKEVPAVIVPTLNAPKAAAPVDPTDCLVSMTMEDAVMAVVEIVAVPPTRVTVPKELAPAVVVDATLVLISLFPAVPRTIFPLVAVIAPRVAVRVVAAVTDPEKLGEPVNAGSAPVEPIRVLPVAATPREDTAFVAPPIRTPCCVTALAVTAEVPLPVNTPVRVVAPVPPWATFRGAATSMFKV